MTDEEMDLMTIAIVEELEAEALPEGEFFYTTKAHEIVRRHLNKLK